MWRHATGARVLPWPAALLRSARCSGAAAALPACRARPARVRQLSVGAARSGASPSVAAAGQHEPRATRRPAPPAAHLSGADDGVLPAEGAPAGRGPTRPVSVFCVAEGFDLKALKRTLANTGWAGRLERVDSDVAFVPFLAPGARADGGSGIASPPAAVGDVFVFDYGVAACWGLSPAQEEVVLAALLGGGCAAGALPASLRERDAFEVAFAPGLAAVASGNKGLCSILNGVITLDARFQAQPALAQLAVSHAIAQSTKLCVFESRVTRLAEASAHIPSAMAAAGEVRMPRREAARLTGQLFLQRSAVNLLSTVLDVPDFLWDSADELQGVYSAVTKYLELKSRVAVLNARYAVLETMLTMVQSQLNDNHASRLEWIIIWLIAVEIGLGLAELYLLHGTALAH